jgi:hypothetical protein
MLQTKQTAHYKHVVPAEQIEKISRPPLGGRSWITHGKAVKASAGPDLQLWGPVAVPQIAPPPILLSFSL